MADLFGGLVTATIRISHDCAERFQALPRRFATTWLRHRQAPDETGFRIGGKTQWLHIASTVLLTFYRVCRLRRGSLLADSRATVAHDHSPTTLGTGAYAVRAAQRAPLWCVN